MLIRFFAPLFVTRTFRTVTLSASMLIEPLMSKFSTTAPFVDTDTDPDDFNTPGSRKPVEPASGHPPDAPARSVAGAESGVGVEFVAVGVDFGVAVVSAGGVSS